MEPGSGARLGRAAAALVALAFVPAASSSHGGIRDQSPSWSPDSARIVFTTNPGRGGEIWVANVDGTGHRSLTSRSSGPNTQPAWSPDGRRIAFASGRLGGWDIYVMNADGSGQTRVTTHPWDDFAPAWSPDGARIAFYRQNAETNRGEIWSIAVDGSAERRLSASAGEDGMPTWSPDGERIAFQSKRDGNWEIYVMRADGSGQTRVTTTPDRHDGEPSWSPDGKQLVFSAGPGEERRDIYVISPDGSGERQLTRLGLPVWAPRFSPDGTRLAFYEFWPGNLYLAKADGSGVTLVFGRLSIVSFSSAPARPVAGRTFTVVLRVAGAGAGATVACDARVGGTRLGVLARGLSQGRASCAWRIPAGAKGERVRGAIAVSDRGARVLRGFSPAVR